MSAFEVFAAARERLRAVPKDALGELREARRTFGIARAPRIVPAGLAWHLGVLLLGDEQVAATGRIIRAREEVRRGFTAESQRERAALAAAARRGGFAEGQTVHLDWHLIDPAALDATTSPLALADGRLMVRWSITADLVPLERYLDERIELLQHPPDRA
jgi:hypothetical protein